MVKKASLRYVCSNCGAVQTAWAGRCDQCGQWNTMVEEVTLPASRASLGALRSGGIALSSEPIASAVSRKTQHLLTQITEIDAILGGGIVPGSVILVGGQPGIGKSTLLLQLASAVAKSSGVLYISGEESAQQVGLRAKRLGISNPKLHLATTNSADDVASTITSKDFGLVLVDSIQTMTVEQISSAAGSVSQVSASTQLMLAAAKQTNTALIIIGHVTKEGSIAGPKVLEHLVDVVLQLEGDSYGGFKLLRSTKNRFGSTEEVGIFEMVESGMQPVKNPSAALLAERQVTDGSVVFAALEGTKPVLVEVQALVNPTSYGYPKRTASGIDLNRLNLLIAVLERRTKLNLNNQDIYLNIVGGIRISEPAADLAICMAIGSAARGMKLTHNAVVFGEVGLSGELRHVPFVTKRLDEAKKQGFELAIGPIQRRGKPAADYVGVPDVRSALNKFLDKK